MHNPDTGDHTLTATLTSAAAGNNCPSGTTDPRCTTTTAITGDGHADLHPEHRRRHHDGGVGGALHGHGDQLRAERPAPASTFTDPLTDVLDDAAYNGDAAATAGTAGFASPDLTWTGTVPATGTVTITFSVTVHNPDTGNHDPGQHADLGRRRTATARAAAPTRAARPP